MLAAAMFLAACDKDRPEANGYVKCDGRIHALHQGYMSLSNIRSCFPAAIQPCSASMRSALSRQTTEPVFDLFAGSDFRRSCHLLPFHVVEFAKRRGLHRRLQAGRPFPGRPARWHAVTSPARWDHTRPHLALSARKPPFFCEGRVCFYLKCFIHLRLPI